MVGEGRVCRCLIEANSSTLICMLRGEIERDVDVSIECSIFYILQLATDGVR